MARELTHDEAVSRARLRLQLLAEKADLELELARIRGQTGVPSQLTGLLPVAAATAAGLLLSRGDWRQRALAVVARLLTR